MKNMAIDDEVVVSLKGIVRDVDDEEGGGECLVTINEKMDATNEYHRCGPHDLVFSIKPFEDAGAAFTGQRVQVDRHKSGRVVVTLLGVGSDESWKEPYKRQIARYQPDE